MHAFPPSTPAVPTTGVPGCRVDKRGGELCPHMRGKVGPDASISAEIEQNRRGLQLHVQSAKSDKQGAKIKKERRENRTSTGIH